MAEANNKALVQRWFDDVWNKGREATIDELFAPDGVGYGLGDTGTPIRGPEQFKPFVRNMRASFPDLQITIEDLLADGDKVVARIVLRATHQGGSLGIAPTGRQVRVEGIVVVRITNGQIVEGWNVWDQLGLMRQIGALPSAEKQDRFLSAHS